MKQHHCSEYLQRHLLAVLLFTGIFTASIAKAQTTGATPTAESGPATAVNTTPIELNPFEVTATSDRGYLSNDSISASRVNTPVGEIPQSIFVVTEELIRDLAPNTLNDIMRYVPGADVPENNTEATTMRGMVVGVPLQDGFRFPRGFPSEQANIERVEVLLGPAGMLYGNVFGTGGVVNRITAKPKFDPMTSLQIQLKDQEYTGRVVLNTTGPVGSSRRMAYRAIISAQKSEYLQDFSHLDRVAFFPSFLYQFSDTASLNVSAEYTVQSVEGGASSRTDYFVNNLIVQMPDAPNPNGGLGSLKIHKAGGQFAFVAKPLEHWTTRVAGLGYWSNNKGTTVPLAAALSADGHSITRRTGGNLRIADRGVGNMFLTADALGDYKFGSVNFKPMLGAEYSFDSDGSYITRATTALADFDYLNPNYTPKVADFTYAFFSDQRVNTLQTAAYTAGVVEFFNRKLLVSGGLRVTDFVQTTRKPDTAMVELDGKTHTVPRYGVLYKVTPGTSVYYSYSEAYQVVTTVNPDGSLLDPIEGQQDEWGVKTSLFDGRLSLTAGIYTLYQINTPQADPARPGYQLSSGGQRSKGYDVSLVASLGAGFQAIAGYSHVKTAISNDANPANVGLSRSAAPPNSASLWFRYAVRSSKLKGLSIALGTVWKDDNPVYVSTQTAPIVYIPSYQTYDAMFGYNWKKRMRFQFNVTNLTDERYYPNGNRTNLTVGAPRTLSLTTTYTF